MATTHTVNTSLPAGLFQWLHHWEWPLTTTIARPHSTYLLSVETSLTRLQQLPKQPEALQRNFSQAFNRKERGGHFHHLLSLHITTYHTACHIPGTFYKNKNKINKCFLVLGYVLRVESHVKILNKLIWAYGQFRNAWIGLNTLILIYGNKMPNRCNRWFLYCRSYCFLNMFQAPLCPSTGAQEYCTGGCCLWYLVLWFSSCQSGVELWVVCLVCGIPQTHSSTPDWQLANQSTKYHRQQPPVQYSWAPDDGHNGAQNMVSKQ